MEAFVWNMRSSNIILPKWHVLTAYQKQRTAFPTEIAVSQVSVATLNFKLLPVHDLFQHIDTMMLK